MNKLEQEVYELAGTEFNINSTKQVGEILFDRLKLDEKAKKTKTGGYSTSEDVLEKLRSKHPIIGKLLEYADLKVIKYLYRRSTRVDQSADRKDTYLFQPSGNIYRTPQLYQSEPAKHSGTGRSGP